MYKTFSKALTWNSITAFLYKVILLSHQIALYSVVSKTFYGLQSSLFATLYLIITITNLGFDDSLLPFFSTFRQSKQHFQQLFYYFIQQVILLCVCAIIITTLFLYKSSQFLHIDFINCNKNIIFILAGIYIIEGIKKSLLTIMQLAFKNKQIALAEIGMLGLYITLIWSYYSYFNVISLEIIFIPMLLTSTLEFLYLLYHCQQFYYTLPKQVETAFIPFKFFFKERYFNFINQISKALYNPNSMTLFFTYFLGFEKAATVKFFTNIITLCYTCCTKIMGVTTGAMLSSMKNMPTPISHSFFHTITYRYLQALTLLGSIVLTIIGYGWYTHMLSWTMTTQILLFFIISFLEQIAITYEQWWISHQLAQQLAILNSIGLCIVGVSGWLYTNHWLCQTSFILMLLSIKIGSLIFLIGQSKRH